MFCTGLGPPGSGSKLNTLRPHNPEKFGTVAARAGPTAAAAATTLNVAAYTDNLCIVARMMPFRWRQSSSEIRGFGGRKVVLCALMETGRNRHEGLGQD